MSQLDANHPALRLTVQMLRTVALFADLDDGTLKRLTENLHLEMIPVGTRVVTEGEQAREMFVVMDGELEVVKRAATGSDVRVALLGPGGWFGEMSILDPQPRSASVRALAPTRVLRVSAEQVDALLYQADPKAYAAFVLNIARELSRRLRVADGIMAQIVGSVNDEYAKQRA